MVVELSSLYWPVHEMQPTVHQIESCWATIQASPEKKFGFFEDAMVTVRETRTWLF